MRWRWANYKAKSRMRTSQHSPLPKFSYLFSLQPQKSLRKGLLLSFPYISSYIGSSREVSITHSLYGRTEHSRDLMEAVGSPSQSNSFQTYILSSPSWKPKPNLHGMHTLHRQRWPSPCSPLRHDTGCKWTPVPWSKHHVLRSTQRPGSQQHVMRSAILLTHCKNPLRNFPHWRA